MCFPFLLSREVGIRAYPVNAGTFTGGTDSKICLGDNKSTILTNDMVVGVVEVDRKVPP